MLTDGGLVCKAGLAGPPAITDWACTVSMSYIPSIENSMLDGIRTRKEVGPWTRKRFR